MNYIVYCILVITTIFQDFELGTIIGEIGKSITTVITPIIFIIYITIHRKLSINKYTKKLIKLFVYMQSINIVALIIYIFIFNSDIYILGENIFFKTIKVSCYFLFIIMYLMLVENLQKKLSIKQVLKPFVYTYFLNFFVLIFEVINKEKFNMLFHQGKDYNRIRLLTAESSFTGTIIIIFFIVTYYYYKNVNRNIIKRNISILMFIPLVVTSSSKGFILCGILSLIFMILSSNKVINWYNKLLIIIICIISINFSYSFFVKSLYDDIQYYTSVSTRGYTIYCSFIYSIKYPFGTGNALYLKFYREIMDNMVGVFYKMNIDFNLSEIYQYIYASNDKNLSAKSSILQYGMYWGIIGNIYFVKKYWIDIYRKIVTVYKKDMNIFIYGFIFIFLTVFSYLNFEIKYEIWAFVSIVTYFIKLEEEMYNKDSDIKKLGGDTK